MALEYLLDTNILSELVRHPHGPITRKIAEVGENAVATSIVASSELRFGAYKSDSPKLRAQVEAVLGAIEVLALDSPADEAYAEIRWGLQEQARPIGPNDMLIASHARALDLTLVTANRAEFQRVPGLRVANWLI
ncbi:type II toxin-antitoxin system VapC family toxin [Thiohalorhabdus sp.]|uniref:type II toxin-antitoxin system VapC family toxin n=1 Tax=Thiohalorhabdus sp. TaxID=3094134 RepID=UPI002FC39D6C